MATQIPDRIAHGAWRPSDRSREILAKAIALARECRSSALLVSRNGATITDTTWDVADPSDLYRLMRHGQTERGAPIEDVASLQKSFLAVLVAVARGRELLTIDTALTDLIGAGWSKAPETESRVTIRHVLSMTSGLDASLGRVAEPGTMWRYNTAVYSHLVSVLEAVAGQPIDALTREWLTGPLGMDQTRWVERTWANPTEANQLGLVTTAADLERLGRLMLGRGEWGGRRVVPADLISECLQPSQTLNPAYGYLWWLNGQDRFLTPFRGIGGEGPYFPTAPMDAVVALGVLDRHLMVAPRLGLVIVRLGDAVAPGRPRTAARFTRLLWRFLVRAIRISDRRSG